MRSRTARRGRFTGSVVGGVSMAMVLALAACGPPEPQAVTLLAGGGDQHLNDVSGAPSPGAEISLDGRITHLTGRGDGTVWGIMEPGHVLSVEADGTTRTRRATGEDGASVELVDVAATPDGAVFVLVMTRSEIRELGSRAGAIYRLDDGNVVRPVDGEYGPVEDIATDSQGRLLMLENVGDPDVGVREHQPHQVRRIEADGSLTTIAGADEVDAPDSADSRTWSDLPDSTPALDLPLYRDTGITIGPDDTVYLASDSSVAAVSPGGGTIRRVGGAAGDDLDFDTGFEDPAEPDIVGLRDQGSPVSVDDDGAVVFNVRAVFDSEDVVAWQVDGGTGRAQQIADGARDDTFGHWPAAVMNDGEAQVVSILGDSAAWLDDETLVLSASDPNSEESILATLETPKL